MPQPRQFAVALLTLLPALPVLAQVAYETVASLAGDVEAQVIEWRRDIHQHPELGNRETRTAALVAEHLERLGMEVTTGVAHTGVVGILKGGQPGPVVMLRADMDALPVEERSGLPFASKATGIYQGEEVPVMHACGHDTHVAMLMGAAEVLAAMRDEIAGTVKFVFQPAEEGPPPGENGGAKMMVEEGVLADPEVGAAFGVHIDSQLEAGMIEVRPGPMMASADDYRITVIGKQSHGAYPWASVDPVVTAAHIVTALQTIVSRNLNLLNEPGVVTVGIIEGGVRNNIIPERVQLTGTIRSLDPDMRAQMHQRVRDIATNVAASMGATVEIELPLSQSIPVTINDAGTLDTLMPALEAAAGPERVLEAAKVTGYEDFSFFANEVPSVFISVGGRDPAVTAEDAPPHHSPDFYVVESGLVVGVKAYANAALTYLHDAQ